MRLARYALIALMVIAFATLAAGAVLAAPLPSSSASNPGQASVASSVPTTTITPTLSFTHPVALAIAICFDIPYTQVVSLHESGLGFGEISRLYMIAKFTDKLPADLLALRESGLGWGEIMKEAHFKPGGKNLGAIMSGHDVKDKDKGGPPDDRGNKDKPECPGKSCDAPGKDKGKP